MEKVYLTNNICESIHAHIAKYIGNKCVSKSLFKETINYIMNHYKYAVLLKLYNYILAILYIMINIFNI